jgi:hypothetical protein
MKPEPEVIELVRRSPVEKKRMPRGTGSAASTYFITGSGGIETRAKQG